MPEIHKSGQTLTGHFSAMLLDNLGTEFIPICHHELQHTDVETVLLDDEKSSLHVVGVPIVLSLALGNECVEIIFFASSIVISVSSSSSVGQSHWVMLEFASEVTCLDQQRRT